MLHNIIAVTSRNRDMERYRVRVKVNASNVRVEPESCVSCVGPWLVYGNTEGDEAIDCRFEHWGVVLHVVFCNFCKGGHLGIMKDKFQLSVSLFVFFICVCVCVCVYIYIYIIEL